jgi:hypothetical protein
MAISVQLFRAIQASDFEAAKRAFNLNPSLVHAKHPRDSHTPLHAAAALGNLQLLRDLLHQGASCQALDCNNETPLHVASRQVSIRRVINTCRTVLNQRSAHKQCTFCLLLTLTSSLCSHSHCAGAHSSCARAADRCRPSLLCEVHQQRWRYTAAPGCCRWARRCGAGVGQRRRTHRCTRQGEPAAADCTLLVVLFALSSSLQVCVQLVKIPDLLTGLLPTVMLHPACDCTQL